MDDLHGWLKQYAFGSDSPALTKGQPTADAKPAPATKKSKKAKKNAQPWFTKFPAKDLVTAMRLQVFDNGENPGAGRNRYTLKLRAYLGVKEIDQRKPDWERTIGLLPPKKVAAWAVEEHAQGRLTDEQLALYNAVADRITAWAEQDDAEAGLMGHISSPPGNHYFHNQFVEVLLTASGEMSAILYVDGDVIDEAKFYTNTRSRKANAPKFHGLYDPFNRIDTKAEEHDDSN